MGSISGLGRSPGEGNGNALQCSCLENPMDRRASQAIVYGVASLWDTTERPSTVAVTPFYRRIHWAQIKEVILTAMRVKSSLHSKRVGGPDSRIHALSVASHVPVSTGFTMTCDNNNKTAIP